MNESVCVPIAASSGTDQFTLTCLLYGEIGGIVPLTVVPSGVVISISVAGDVSTSVLSRYLEFQGITGVEHYSHCLGQNRRVQPLV